MKVKVNWKELARQLWEAVKPVLIGAVGGGLVAVTTSGCSSLTPSNKQQSISVIGLGIPAVAIMTSTTQNADNSGGDQNAASQADPVTTVVPVGK